MSVLDLIPPIIGDPAKGKMALIFHFVIAAIVIGILAHVMTTLVNTTRTPTPLTGWGTHDYDAEKGARASLAAYLQENTIPDTTPMVQFSVATANFGGIFTEDMGSTNPWLGTVSPEAARLQVEAGARAMVLDVWPDPADRTRPVVCAMLDTQEWFAQRWWVSQGLNRGVGRYSNWQMLTRNKVPVGDILKAAVTAAFSGSPGPQNTDPFFIILKLHGAMTVDYLNRLGDTVIQAIGGHAMSTEYNKAGNQRNLCTAPVKDFLSKAFVIVIPDIQTGYNSLPNTNTYPGFTTQFMTTRLADATNVLEQGPNQVWFEPGSASTISTPTQPNCQLGGPQLTPAQAGFCVIQPSIGGQSTRNEDLFASNSYSSCLKSGAQFVAINLFSPKSSDAPLEQTYFTPSWFGKYSWKKGA
jgi:hypothetical protein